MPPPPAAVSARVTELESALDRARQAVEAFRRIGAAVGSLDLDDLLELVLRAATEALSAERATIYLREGERLVSRVRRGEEAVSIELPWGRGIAGYVAETQKSLCLADAYKHPQFDPTWDEKSGFRTGSMLAVPLLGHEGETIGVLQALNKRCAEGRRPLFTPFDRELAEALAVQVVIALDIAGLVDRLRRKNELLSATSKQLKRSNRDLELLYELENTMGRAETVEELAKGVIELTGRACDAAAGALLHCRDEGEATLYVVNLAQPEEVRQVVVQRGEGIAARALAKGTLLRIDEPRKVGDPERVKELLGLELRSAVAAPLGHEEGISGALALYNHAGDEGFDTEDAALLKLVSANVLTELRVLESRRQRQQSERLGAIGQVLSGVLHDLRTPLTVVSGYVQLMAASEDRDERLEHLETVLEQFDIIAGMQRDLLAYARGETDLLVRKVYLDKFLDGLARQFTPQLEGRSISLEVKLERKIGVYFDEARMARALGNLLRNAMEAMEKEGGKLTLAARVAKGDLIIEVRDQGAGIPKEIRRTLFLPFVTSGKKTGTGLGLSNVKEIVEEHGGRVEVSSSRRGTCFTVRLPDATEPPGLRRGPLSSRRLS